jgi:predicted O-linked N-acetylglucosamine transferase (SPINDLY family)
MTSPPPSQDIGNVLQRALALHQSGQLAQAEFLYREALGQAPDHFDALHLLGVIELQRRNFEAAVSLISRAVRQRDHAPAYSNLGTALLELKRHHEALANYDRALVVEPDHAEALNNRGTALRALGRLEEALASYDRALAVQAGYVAAWTNRGNVLRALGRDEDALASYDRAAALKPDNAALLFDRGAVLLRLGRHDAALASYDQALAIRPDFVEALNGRGAALFGLRRHEEALAAYNRALSIKPDYVEALSNRGSALLLLGRGEAALESYSEALAVNPRFADAWKNRGSTLLVLKRFDEAAKDFAAHLALVPEAKYTKGELLYAKLCCCDWQGHGEAVRAVVDEVLAGRPVIAPFAFLSVSDSPVAQQKCAATYGTDKYAPTAARFRHEARHGRDKIRIAYLSADFRDHPVAHAIVELFERHDGSRFETTGISFGSESRSAIRARLDGALDRLIDVRAERDPDVARLLQHLQIDIAVDLSGYTTDCRPGILASRPAPVQASYFGFSGTMGVDHIDYILADRIVLPEAAQPHYTEKIVYLPDSYLPSDARRRIGGHTPSRQEAGLPETGFVFCSFNNGYKVTPAVCSGCWAARRRPCAIFGSMRRSGGSLPSG